MSDCAYILGVAASCVVETCCVLQALEWKREGGRKEGRRGEMQDGGLGRLGIVVQTRTQAAEEEACVATACVCVLVPSFSHLHTLSSPASHTPRVTLPHVSASIHHTWT